VTYLPVFWPSFGRARAYVWACYPLGHVSLVVGWWASQLASSLCHRACTALRAYVSSCVPASAT